MPDHEIQTTDFDYFCNHDLTAMLRETYKVDAAQVSMIVDDIRTRAAMYKSLTTHEQAVLNTTVWEEVYYHEPSALGLDALAATVIVVRNSALENIHAMGGVLKQSDIKQLSITAATPLVQYLQAPTQNVDTSTHLFKPLQEKYPRAWAALEALLITTKQRGRKTYSFQASSVDLQLPKDAGKSETLSDGTFVANAISETFDSQLVEGLTRVKEHTGVPIFAPTFSRLSRNTNKLFFILEWVIAHNGMVLTINHLIEPAAVWTRKGHIIQTDSFDPYQGLQNTVGLKGTHRSIAVAVRNDLSPQ